jgi:hypothetical protein
MIPEIIEFTKYVFMAWVSYGCISKYTTLMNTIKLLEQKQYDLSIRFDTFNDCIQQYVLHNTEKLKDMEPLLKLRVEKLEEDYTIRRHIKDHTYNTGDVIRYGDGNEYNEVTALILAVIPLDNAYIELIAKRYQYAYEELLSIKISKRYDAKVPHPYGIHIRDKRVNPFSSMVGYISTAPSQYTMNKL